MLPTCNTAVTLLAKPVSNLFEVTPALLLNTEAALLREGLVDKTMQEVLDFEDRVVAEDLALQERFDVPGLPLDSRLELPVKADQCGLELRKLMRQPCSERNSNIAA